MRFCSLAIALSAAVSCSADATRAPVVGSPAAEEKAIAETSGRYQLRFAGVPVGTTDLGIKQTTDGYQFRRDDRISVLRDGQQVDSMTSIVVETNSSLTAQQVTVRSVVGPLEHSSHAERDDGGWVIRNANGKLARRSGIELAELSLWRPNLERARGPMLLAGASFALLEINATRSQRGGFQIDLESDLGTSSIELELSSDGLPKQWNSETGESAIRTDGIVSSATAAELLDLAAMPSRGRPGRTLVIEDANRRAPPSFSWQRLRVSDNQWTITFKRHPKRAIPADLASLVVGVDQRIEDDLTMPGLSGAEALRMGRGDCSAHASALALLANANGYRAKLATGYRRRGHQWLRHRWTVVELGGEWVSLDPSFAEARPALARLLVLAIHDATPEAMALADLFAFSGMTAATARFK